MGWHNPFEYTQAVERTSPPGAKHRVELELEELCVKRGKLLDFKQTQMYARMSLGEQNLLTAQLSVMNAYADILRARLNAWREHA